MARNKIFSTKTPNKQTSLLSHTLSLRNLKKSPLQDLAGSSTASASDYLLPNQQRRRRFLSKQRHHLLLSPPPSPPHHPRCIAPGGSSMWPIPYESTISTPPRWFLQGGRIWLRFITKSTTSSLLGSHLHLCSPDLLHLRFWAPSSLLKAQDGVSLSTAINNTRSSLSPHSLLPLPLPS